MAGCFFQYLASGASLSWVREQGRIQGQVSSPAGWTSLPQGGPLSRGVDLSPSGWTSLPRGGPLSHGVDLSPTGWTSLPWGGPLSCGVDLSPIGWTSLPQGGPLSHGVDLSPSGWTSLPWGEPPSPRQVPGAAYAEAAPHLSVLFRGENDAALLRVVLHSSALRTHQPV